MTKLSKVDRLQSDSYKQGVSMATNHVLGTEVNTRQVIGIDLTLNQLLNIRYAVEQQAVLNRSLAVDCQKDPKRANDYNRYNAIAIFYEDMFVKFGDILKDYGLLVDSNPAIFIPSGRSDSAKIITRIGGE